MKAKMTIPPFEEYLERIAKAGRDIDISADRALEAGGEVAEAGMKRRVAVRTGNLQAHIHADPPKQDGSYHSVEIGLMGADKDTARYGNAQEFGTSSMPAHPYMRTTMDEDKGQIRAAMRESLKKDGAL